MPKGKFEHSGFAIRPKLRVLIDGCIFNYQTTGGISKLWARILYEWSRRDDVEITLVSAPGNKNIHLQSAGLPASIRRFEEPLSRPTYLISNSVYRGMLLAQVEKQYGPFDIFHSSFYSMSCARGVPGIITVHDLIDEIYAKSNRGGVFSRMHIHAKRDVIRRAAGLVAVSKATEDDLRQYYPECAYTPVFVCPNAADDTFKRPEAEIGRRTQKSKSILHVGRRGGYKNFSLIVSALACAETSGYLLQIVGGEPFSLEESRFLRNARISYEVLGEVSDEKLASLYADAFCLVSASRNEGFGIPIVEAMASGCPVVCSDISPHREVTKGIALFFDPLKPRDCLNALVALDDAEVRLSQVRRGWEHAIERSYSDVASELLSVYRDVLGDVRYHRDNLLNQG